MTTSPIIVHALRDNLMHLVADRDDLKTVCHTDVKSLTMIPLHRFGVVTEFDGQPEYEWCEKCGKKLGVQV